MPKRKARASMVFPGGGISPGYTEREPSLAPPAPTPYTPPVSYEEVAWTGGSMTQTPGTSPITKAPLSPADQAVKDFIEKSSAESAASMAKIDKSRKEFEKKQEQSQKRTAGKRKRRRLQERKTLLAGQFEEADTGLRETILTGPAGVLGDSPRRRKTLLGL